MYPVWAGDIDRMFISLVPPSYDGGDGVLPAPAQGWAEMSEIACTGSGSVLAIGDVVMPARPWDRRRLRSEEHTSELQSLMRISYAVFWLKKKRTRYNYYKL